MGKRKGGFNTVLSNGKRVPMKKLKRRCLVCGSPVIHYLDDARQCFMCRRAVLESTDSFGAGATGDPAFYPGDCGWVCHNTGLDQDFPDDSNGYVDDEPIGGM